MRLGVLLALWLQGCATATTAGGGSPGTLPPPTPEAERQSPSPPAQWSDWPRESGFGAAAAGAGRALVGLRSLKSVAPHFTDDCVGFVRLVYAKLQVELIDDGVRGVRGGVPAIWDTMRRRGLVHFHLPQPGDLVFFTETYDRNHDGRRDDGLTHVGLVELVDASGGVWFLHRSGHGIERSRLDLNRRSEHTDGYGALLNDYLRMKDRSGDARLTGELLYGFASVRP
jgi:cell wall-associated NlpC family hydrolase